MTKKQKKMLTRISISAVIFAVLMALKLFFLDDVNWIIEFLCFFALYIYIGYDVLKKTFNSIRNARILDEVFLMSIASLGAFALGIYTGLMNGVSSGFDEACAVMIFYQIGEFIQGFATHRSRKSIKSLLDIKSDTANLITEDGIKNVDAQDVEVESLLRVNIGERVPIDGVVVEGNSLLDTKSLTGESLPKNINIGDQVLSGCVNLMSPITIKTCRKAQDSTASRILDLVENIEEKKSKPENFITRFSKYYTPIVVALALLIAIIPPLVILFVGNQMCFDVWVYRALSFLVVSCPCALIISVPLCFFQGLGVSYKNGVLIKGSVFLESLSKADSFVFDKTGTLTKGNFAVTKIEPRERRDEIIHLAQIAEKDLDHPIAKAINALICHIDDEDEYTITNTPGKGTVARREKHTVYCGNEKLLSENSIALPSLNFDEGGVKVLLAKDGEFIGYILLEDELKEESKTAVSALMKNASVHMLTGDNEENASKVASSLSLTSYRASLLPEDKLRELEKIKSSSACTAYIGDGINDSPALSLADVGISMGALGSDAAIEASDIVITNDNLTLIPKSCYIAKKTMHLAKENIIFAIGIKALILITSALGLSDMWMAVFADVGVSIIAILNSFRVSFYSRGKV